MSILSNTAIHFFSKSITVSKHVLLLSKCPKFSKFRVFSTKTRSKPLSKGMFKIGLAGIAVGAVVGTGYSIHYMNQPRAHILNEEIVLTPLETIPEITPTKSIKLSDDSSGLKLTLFQYQTCPFCCKVRAFLDYYGISYDVVEVDPVLRQAIIKWSPYKKVPILVAKTNDGYQPLNDSTMIVSALATYLKDAKKDLTEIAKCFPFINFIDDSGKKKMDIMNRYFVMTSNATSNTSRISEQNEERKWRQWADDVLVHTLSPNVYRTKEEALQAFNWFSHVGEWENNFPSWERYLIIYVGATAMYYIGKKLKKRHNLKDDVRQSLYEECNHWMRNINAKGTLFMGGQQPNLADLAVFGVLSSIEGCIAFQDLMKNSNIGSWYSSMKDAVTQHRGATFV